MTVNTVLEELFSTWLSQHRGLYEIVLCDEQGLPIVSAGEIAQVEHAGLSAATSSVYSISINIRDILHNDVVEYVLIKMTRRKVVIWKLPTQDMYVMFYVSSVSIATQREMVRNIDYIIRFVN